MESDLNSPRCQKKVQGKCIFPTRRFYISRLLKFFKDSSLEQTAGLFYVKIQKHILHLPFKKIHEDKNMLSGESARRNYVEASTKKIFKGNLNFSSGNSEGLKKSLDNNFFTASRTQSVFFLTKSFRGQHMFFFSSRFSYTGKWEKKSFFLCPPCLQTLWQKRTKLKTKRTSNNCVRFGYCAALVPVLKVVERGVTL